MEDVSKWAILGHTVEGAEAAMRELLPIAFGVLKSGKPFDAAVCVAVLPAKKQQKPALAA